MRTRINSPLAAAAILALSFVAPGANSSARAESGVTDSTILFGQAAALEGPAAALGTGMRAGILAAFEEVNRKGGVNGHKLELKSYDDSYEPQKSIDQVKKLIEEDQVFALIGSVGTPTSKATQPIATQAKVPFIAPFTGAGFLRNVKLGNVVNVRASYDAETETWIHHLVDGLKFKNIAILYQDDSFGRVGLAGVRKAMEKRGLSLVAEGTYERNTLAVKTALIEIRKQKPDAVVMVGAYKPIAEFIKVARSISFNPTFVNISFVGSNALAEALGPTGDGVIISQVVPFPGDASIALVKQYQAAIKAIDPKTEPSFVSLEGYMAGRLTIMALEKTPGAITRDAFLNTIWSTGTFDLGGVTLTYGAEDNQGMDDVFLTVIYNNGKFKPVEKLSM